jgi:cytochrome c oxidase cbb3-type subunit 3
VSCSRAAVVAALAAVCVLTACEREARRFSEPASKASPVQAARLSPIQPGTAGQRVVTKNSYEENAYAISQGERLFTWFNCVGCHAHGGGGSGPALMDEKWIYGSDPAVIHETIVEGRPNGMPAFGGKIPDAQIWQIVAYVRSMSGFVRSDTAPGRADEMAPGKGPEATRDPLQPVQSGVPQPR